MKKAGKYQEWLTEEKLFLIECWARDGLIESQIAHNMGVGYSTLREWKKKFPAIKAALKKGKEIIDFEVESMLLKRAMGYDYEEEEAIKIKLADGSERVEIRKVKKKAHPDVTAQIFWLKNRKPEQWRENKTKLEAEEINSKIKLNEVKTKILENEANRIMETTESKIADILEDFINAD